MKTAFRTLLVIGVGVEIALLVFAAVSSTLSGWWALMPLTVIAAALALLFTGMVVDRRRAGSWAVSLSATAARFGVPRKALALLVSEVRSLRSSAGVFSRPVVPAGDEAHPGHRNLRTVVLLVLGLVAVEIVVVHLAAPSRFWRILLFILSVYALILLLGFYTRCAGIRTCSRRGACVCATATGLSARSRGRTSTARGRYAPDRAATSSSTATAKPGSRCSARSTSALRWIRR